MIIESPIRLPKSGLLNGTDLRKVCDLILARQCVVLPTDTGYMMAVNALDVDAVEKLYRLKQRPFTNPIHVAVCSERQADELVSLSQKAYRLIDRFLPGALTVIAPKKSLVSDLLVAETGNLGIRIPDMPVIMQITTTLQRPITATSTNISSKPPLDKEDDIVNTFSDQIAALVMRPDNYCFLKHSTVVRIIDDNVEILRDGPISKEEIERASEDLAYVDVNEWT